ncbi:hypothetical protein IW150_003661 [Coemansia sp. RSA 2607]|nr:hypothetical protein IW150_003661 [Coemansia sp. RSA 2607]
MKFFLAPVIACMAASVACSPAIYYQPNGVFAPISVSVPAVIQQQQQQQQQLSQTHTAQNNVNSNSVTPPNPWSLISTYWFNQGIRSQQSTINNKSQTAPPAKQDPAAAMLAQILNPLKFVATSFLAGLEIQLEKADPKSFANVLRGPITDLKNYLASIWPTAPPAKTPQPTPATFKPPQSSSPVHK